MKNSEIFEKAAKIVMERGLKKNDYGRINGPVCFLGAISEARCGDPQDTFNGHYFVDIPGGASSAMHFSDDPGTTVDEVVQVLQFMALAEKEEGR